MAPITQGVEHRQFLIEIYQLIPTSGSSGNLVPDPAYYTIIPENTVCTSNSNGTKFLTVEKVDFTFTGSTEVTFVDNDYFLLRKQVKAISAEIKTTSINFGSTPQKFSIGTIKDTNILQVLQVTSPIDDTGINNWYEVPYLAQDTIMDDTLNINYNDPNFSIESGNVPYILKLKNMSCEIANGRLEKCN